MQTSDEWVEELNRRDRELEVAKDALEGRMREF